MEKEVIWNTGNHTITVTTPEDGMRTYQAPSDSEARLIAAHNDAPYVRYNSDYKVPLHDYRQPKPKSKPELR